MKHSSAFAITLVTSVVLLLSSSAWSQTSDSTKPANFTGAAGITNNGISVVPTFTFDKPAAILLATAGKKRLTFEPDVRFTLDIKRGGVALWWRYKFLTHGKFRLNAGAHPAINFMYDTDSAKGGSNFLATQKFLGAELVPNYILSKNVSLGIYYLRGHGLQKDGPRNVHFLTVNSNFSNIIISRQLFVQWIPQFYYLNIDKRDGIYFTSAATLSKRDFPLSIQSIFNKVITTKIPGSKNFVWNVTLFYAFKGR